MMHTVTTQAEATTGSLLDRLSIRSTDQIADATVSRGDLQATSPRESILRNLQWLLNTTRLESSRDLQGWPHIRRSVLNFGIPELSGQYLSSVDSERLEQQMVEAIVLFEPRLVPETVQVRVIADDTQTTARALTLIITGECLPALCSVAVRLAAHIDLESGRVLKISH